MNPTLITRLVSAAAALSITLAVVVLIANYALPEAPDAHLAQNAVASIR